MKKIFAVILVVLSTVLAVACEPLIEKREANLSELRDTVMTGSDERVSVTLISGKREDPFVIDGEIAEQKTDFTVITVKGSFDESVDLSYRLSANGETYEGVLSRHPFKSSYSVELAVRTVGEASVLISGGDYAQNLQLSSVITPETISADEALEIAEARLSKSIDEMTDDGELCAEIYIRLLENPISSEGGYYWYVAFVPEKYVSYAVLIHSQTREIVAVKE